MKSYEKLAIAACVLPGLFVLSAWLYYPVLALGEWLGLWGDPPERVAGMFGRWLG